MATVNDRLTKHVDAKVQQRKSEERQAQKIRDNALEKSERREWANKKFGDERRWRE